MSETPATYSVGRGKPPLHTRFQKGQSGNPTGKPGPAKLAKQRFQRALYAALEGSEAELEQSKPDSVLVGIARRMALDAVGGRMSAIRQVLSLLDAESATSAEAEGAAEDLFTGEELLSLLQGKTQGNEKLWLEDILWPDVAPAYADTCDEQGRKPAPATAASRREEAELFSLPQGKNQGNGKTLLEDFQWPTGSLQAARVKGGGDERFNDAKPATSGPKRIS